MCVTSLNHVSLTLLSNMAVLELHAVVSDI